MAEIIFQHITKTFRDVIALEDVSFEVEKGEFVFIIGKSGAGKSTLLNLISRMLEPTKGEITVFGQRLSRMPEKEIPYYRRKLGVMSRDVGLLQNRTVYENIAFVMIATEQKNRKMRERILQTLGKVGMAGKVDSYPYELSGGEQARVLLARALCMEPEILIADEPTANLDSDAAWDLMQLLAELNYKGLTILVASHARELVTIMKKRCITLVTGAIVADEKKSIYNSKAVDIFEERRILEKRRKNRQ